MRQGTWILTHSFGNQDKKEITESNDETEGETHRGLLAVRRDAKWNGYQGKGERGEREGKAFTHFDLKGEPPRTIRLGQLVKKLLQRMGAEWFTPLLLVKELLQRHGENPLPHRDSLADQIDIVRLTIIPFLEMGILHLQEEAVVLIV